MALYPLRGCRSLFRFAAEIPATPKAAPLASAHASAKLLPLFLAHPGPALFHMLLPVASSATAAMEPAKQNLREDQQSQPLPVGDGVQAENPRHQPIPQVHDDEAEDRRGNHDKRNHFQNFSNTMVHLFSLITSQNFHRLQAAVCEDAAPRSASAKAMYSRSARFPLLAL